MARQKGFKTDEVKSITGLDTRMVTYYAEKLQIEAEVDPGEGRGKIKRYSHKNLFEFFIVKELHGYGVALKNMQELFRLLRFPLPAGRDNKGKIHKLNMEGYAGAWDKIPEGAFLVIYKMDTGGFHPEICQLSAGQLLDPHKLEKCSNVLMINLGRIANNIRSL
jgi:DNA-binding transcriptional MerR regulator